jgi:hypothetical protein
VWLEGLGLPKIYTFSLVSNVSRLQTELQENRGSIPGGGRDFSFRRRFQTGSGTHPASYPLDTKSCFTGGKPAGAVKLAIPLCLFPKVKKEWEYSSSPHYFIAWCLIKPRGNFVFTFVVCIADTFSRVSDVKGR